MRENIEVKELLMSKLECLEDKVGKTTTGASEEESWGWGGKQITKPIT